MRWHWFINLFLILAVLSSYLAQQTADPLANTKTKQVLAYIAGLPAQGKLLSGQFAGYSPDTFSTSIINQTTQQTGKTPGILGCDWACGWDTLIPPQNLINYSCNAALKSHWNLGGLVTISMHLPNPVSPNGGYYNNPDGLNFADLINTTTTTGQRWLLFLGRMAQGLYDLQQSGVTVLFRPFHEMNGNWFFWGNQNPQTFINVWINMFNYLTNTNNLHNILWVYAPDQSRVNRSAYYPGAAYVDIVALDVYVDNPNTTNGYNEMTSLNKPFALGEVGPATTNGQFDYTLWLTAIATIYPKIAYFLAWNDNWAPIANQNAPAFYNNPRMVNLGGIALNNSLITTTTTTTSSTTTKTIPSTTTTSTARSSTTSAARSPTTSAATVSTTSATRLSTTATTTSSTTSFTKSSTSFSSSSPSSAVIYNFSMGIGQWQVSIPNVNGGPWESNEFTYASTDSLKADVLLYAGGQYYFYTDQNSTFTFSNYKTLFAQARVASWGFQSGDTMTGKLYIKTGSSWTWYDSGAVQLNSNSATQLVLYLNSIPSSALANIREVGVQYTLYTTSANGAQTSIYLAYITAQN